MDIAADVGLDLVEVAPNSKPPVVKILDYGKYKYQAQKKAAEARKNQKTVDVKEIKMRPNIDTHDYDVKMRNARRFLDDENKVKVTMRFRGREMAHQELGLDLLFKVRDELGTMSKVEYQPKMEGRQMIMILAPIPLTPAQRASRKALQKELQAKEEAEAEAAAATEAENAEAEVAETEEIAEPKVESAESAPPADAAAAT